MCEEGEERLLGRSLVVNHIFKVLMICSGYRGGTYKADIKPNGCQAMTALLL